MGCDASDQVINTSGAPSSCCYCRAAKFGPRAQSPRLQANQLNQHSLIPASRHSFIKGLDEVSSNFFFFFCFFLNPDHFPPSHVTQWQIFPHLVQSLARRTQGPFRAEAVIEGKKHMDHTLSGKVVLTRYN